LIFFKKYKSDPLSKERGLFFSNKKRTDTVNLVKTTLDCSLLSKTIFVGTTYHTTNTGLEIPKVVKDELERFLKLYLEMSGIKETEGVFFRVDLYPDEEDGVFWIIEVNALFVDGWGIALNFTRATGQTIKIEDGLFPKVWTTEDPLYVPELELACQELTLATGQKHEFEPASSCRHNQHLAYWYGRSRLRENLWPTNGELLDDKILLCRMATRWNGRCINIPESFSSETGGWDHLPDRQNLVFKLRRKWTNPRMSVQFGDQIGKGKFWRKLWCEDEAIAQTRIKQTATADNQPVQAIVLTAGSRVIAGYIQLAQPGTRIINDNSVHGPIIFG
jgi:hypothetical protein